MIPVISKSVRWFVLHNQLTAYYMVGNIDRKWDNFHFI